MARSTCTTLLAPGLIEFPSEPAISPALNDLACKATPLLHPCNRNAEALGANESRGQQ
jgi:hypothetical protein